MQSILSLWSFKYEPILYSSAPHVSRCMFVIFISPPFLVSEEVIYKPTGNDMSKPTNIQAKNKERISKYTTKVNQQNMKEKKDQRKSSETTEQVIKWQ